MASKAFLTVTPTRACWDFIPITAGDQCLSLLQASFRLLDAFFERSSPDPEPDTFCRPRLSLRLFGSAYFASLINCATLELGPTGSMNTIDFSFRIMRSG
jgi:hypothetical protein